MRGCHWSCRLQLHQAQRRDGTEIKILGDLLLQMIDQGNLIDSPQQVIQNWIMTVLGLLKGGKVRLRHTIDQRNPIKTSWNAVQQVRPHHEDALLDGGGQSVRYGGMLHDRSGQPDNANSQEEADSETFVMGSGAEEFANKVKDQVRKRQKRMSNVSESRNHLSSLLSISHFNSTECSEVMSKRTQKDRGEERVTAKSKPMMNFCIAMQRKRLVMCCLLLHQKAR